MHCLWWLQKGGNLSAVLRFMTLCLAWCFAWPRSQRKKGPFNTSRVGMGQCSAVLSVAVIRHSPKNKLGRQRFIWFIDCSLPLREGKAGTQAWNLKQRDAASWSVHWLTQLSFLYIPGPPAWGWHCPHGGPSISVSS